MKRIFAVVSLGIILVLVGACSGAGVGRGGGNQTAFPTGYKAWRKLNTEPVKHEAENSSRDIFANDVAVHRRGPSFPIGSILVKEEHLLTDELSRNLSAGDVFRVSVMFKVGRGNTSGWSFKAFDPATGEEFSKDSVDPDGCYYCHVDAQERDYVFWNVPAI